MNVWTFFEHFHFLRFTQIFSPIYCHSPSKSLNFLFLPSLKTKNISLCINYLPVVGVKQPRKHVGSRYLTILIGLSLIKRWITKQKYYFIKLKLADNLSPWKSWILQGKLSREIIEEKLCNLEITRGVATCCTSYLVFPISQLSYSEVTNIKSLFSSTS